MPKSRIDGWQVIVCVSVVCCLAGALALGELPMFGGALIRIALGLAALSGVLVAKQFMQDARALWRERNAGIPRVVFASSALVVVAVVLAVAGGVLAWVALK